MDLTFKARKVYDEVLRLRKKFHKVKDRLRRYEIEDKCIKRENNLPQSHIDFLQTKSIVLQAGDLSNISVVTSHDV